MELTLYLGIWISLLNLAKGENPQNCVQPHLNQILSRPKRFLTFPPGSSFAVKRSFTKSVVENIPRGLSLTVDIGVYYPLPVSADAWDLTKLLYRLDLSHTGGLSATPKPKKGVVSNPVVDINSTTTLYPIIRYELDQKMHLYPYANDVRYQSFKWNGKGNYYPGEIYSKFPLRRQFNLSQSSTNEDTLERDPDYIPLIWNTYQGRIDRNDLQQPYKSSNRRGKHLSDSFESLGAIFKVDLEACIQRAICEFKDDLLPSGKSLIVDIAKIFFDVDESTKIPGEQSGNCVKRFLVSCPHSPFEFFKRNLRLNLNDQDVIKNLFPSV